MTDKEIIKALECCKRDFSIRSCLDCPYHEEKSAKCMSFLIEDVLTLINRQQAEIERLKAENEKAKTYLANCFGKYEKTKIAKDSLENTLYTARAEAIKELIGRLENDYTFEILKGDNYWEKVVRLQAIKNVAKEMVGEDK